MWIIQNVDSSPHNYKVLFLSHNNVIGYNKNDNFYYFGEIVVEVVFNYKYIHIFFMLSIDPPTLIILSFHDCCMRIAIIICYLFCFLVCLKDAIMYSIMISIHCLVTIDYVTQLYILLNNCSTIVIS